MNELHSTCSEHPNIHLHEELYMPLYDISFMHPYKQFGRWQDVCIKHILPSTRLLEWLHERNTIKLHVHVFLRMNTWMVETFRRQHN